MSGSMSNLYVGVTGLNTAQTALNTTSHNLANVGTDGYTRQQLVITDTYYQSVKNGHISSNQVGFGANVDAIRQVRNAFLDKSYRLESSRMGFYQSQAQVASEVEDLFGELEGVAFQQSLESFWTSLQELAKTPDDLTTRKAFIQTSVSFVERASEVYNQLTAYQVSLNTEITDQVNSINSLGDRINKLNETIRQYEANGQNANDYRDQRNALLDELSGYSKITYRELQDGTVTVNLEGVQFVTDTGVNYLNLEYMNDTSQMLKPVWSHIGDDVYDLTKQCNSNDNTDVGSLKGLLLARGDGITNYTDIPIKPNADDFDTAAAYEDALKQYDKEVETYNNTVNQSVIQTVLSQFDQLIHGVVSTVNDILCPNKDVTITLEDGTTKTITVLDEKNAAIGYGEGNDYPGTELFSRKGMDRYESVQYTLEDGSVVTYQVYNKEDETNNYSLYTLGEIEVNKKLLENASLLPLTSNDGTGAYCADICDKLTEAWSNKFAALDPNTQTVSTFKDYYTNFVGALANRLNSLELIADSQEATVKSVDDQRQQVMGVSTDEELSNLIRFQQSYNAASRYINVVSEMIEDLISALG